MKALKNHLRARVAELEAQICEAFTALRAAGVAEKQVWCQLSSLQLTAALRYVRGWLHELEEVPRKKRRFECPCCGESVLTETGSWEVCSSCGWQDERVTPGEVSGCNSDTIINYYLRVVVKVPRRRRCYNQAWDDLLGAERRRNVRQINFARKLIPQLINDKKVGQAYQLASLLPL